MVFPTIYFRKSSFFVFNKAFYYSLLVILIPWQYIMKVGKWQDFEVTVEYYTRVFQTKVEIYKLDSLSGFLSFEVIWDYLLIWMTSVFGDPAIGLRIFSFVILFIWGIFLFRRLPTFWALLFLLTPLSIDISMSIIRNGLAWALIIWGAYLTSNKIIKYLLFILAPFIHTSSLGILVLLFVSNRIEKMNLSKNKLIMIMAITGIGIGLGVTIFSQILSYILNDGRLASNYTRGGGSVMQMLFFVILLSVQIFCNKDYIKENLFIIGILFWYITMNPFIPWSYRMWSALIPLIGYSIWLLPINKRQIILFLWSGNLILWYMYWTVLFDYWYPV